MLTFSVSAATRAPRANEQDGVDYLFIALEEFKYKIQHDVLVEWELVY